MGHIQQCSRSYGMLSTVFCGVYAMPMIEPGTLWATFLILNFCCLIHRFIFHNSENLSKFLHSPCIPHTLIHAHFIPIRLTYPPHPHSILICQCSELLIYVSFTLQKDIYWYLINKKNTFLTVPEAGSLVSRCLLDRVKSLLCVAGSSFHPHMRLVYGSSLDNPKHQYYLQRIGWSLIPYIKSPPKDLLIPCVHCRH